MYLMKSKIENLIESVSRLWYSKTMYLKYEFIMFNGLLFYKLKGLLLNSLIWVLS